MSVGTCSCKWISNDVHCLRFACLLLLEDCLSGVSNLLDCMA